MTEDRSTMLFVLLAIGGVLVAVIGLAMARSGRDDDDDWRHA